MAVQAGLCQIWSEPELLVFSCTGSVKTVRVSVGNYSVMVFVLKEILRRVSEKITDVCVKMLYSETDR